MSAQSIVERAGELLAILSAPSLDHQALVDAIGRAGELRRLIDGVGTDLAGQIERLSGPEREDSLARAFGERSAAVLVEVTAGLEATEAHRWCRVGAAIQPDVTLQGEVLPARHPFVAAAFACGGIRLATADRVLETLAEIEPYSSIDERAEVERFLVEAAPGLTDRQFARLCGAIPDRFDQDSIEPREDLLRMKSGVRVTHTRDGLVRWIVTMHPEAAGFLTAAVDARTAPRRLPSFRDSSEPPADPDPRPLSERRVDALTSIARESLAHDAGRLAGRSVTMSVTVTLDALQTGLGTAKIAGIDAPISASTARRLAADAEIIPVLLGGPSQQLDLGRTVRLATESQRRALEVRDQGCIWGSCDAPPGWCEVAHIVPWADGGSTDLDNMMLLCAFHHRRFDRDGWALEQRDGERHLIPPPWVDHARIPRRAGPLPAMQTA